MSSPLLGTHSPLRQTQSSLGRTHSPLPRIHSSLPRNKSSPRRLVDKEVQRKSYTIEKKLEIIKFYYDNGCNKSLVERKFGVARASLLEWLKLENTNCASDNKETRTRLASRYFNGKWPLLDDELYKFFLNQTKNKRPISSKNLLQRSIKLAKELMIDDFVRSYGYIEKFKTRFNIVRRRITHQSQEDEIC